jgi:hypothetical protein
VILNNQNMPRLIDRFTVYIDFAINGKDDIFARKIADRLKSIKDGLDVVLFSDFKPNEHWEQVTLEAMQNADIIIPIISPDYFGYVTSGIEQLFDKISKEKTKYLFPILFRPSNWTSNWLVRVKVIPEDNISISEHSDNDSDKILNAFISSINDIVINGKLITTPNVQMSEIIKGQTDMVFISHDHDDADFAELLKLQLEKNGIVGWLDNEKLKIGQDWREEIDVNIANSLAVIAIMTPEARKSEYVTYEWSFAWGKGKKIFPLMLKQTQLHPRLESLQYLDFSKRNSRPYDMLIKSIKELAK